MKVSLHIDDISESELPRLARLMEAVSHEPMFTRAELGGQPNTGTPPLPPAMASKSLDLRAFAAAPATPFTPPPPAAETDIQQTMQQYWGTTAVAAPVAAPVTDVVPLQTPPAIETDADGVPWDGRIHSSSKARTADGRWRARRGVSDEAAAKVAEELKAAKNVPAPTPAPETPTGSITFAQFMRLATTKLAASPGYAAEILNACVAVGLPNLPALASRPDLVPGVAKTLGLAP